MLIKIAGIIFVIGSTVMAGFYYGSIETYRINDLTEMKKALAILKSEIEFAMTPLPEALESIANRTKKPINKIFIRFREMLVQRESDSIGEMWKQAISEYERETYFNKEDMESLISFGRTLGYLDKGMQLSSIQIMTGYIDDKIILLNESRFKNKKMFQSLGLLGGILVVIVFI